MNQNLVRYSYRLTNFNDYVSVIQCLSTHPSTNVCKKLRHADGRVLSRALRAALSHRPRPVLWNRCVRLLVKGRRRKEEGQTGFSISLFHSLSPLLSRLSISLWISGSGSQPAFTA